MERIFDHHHKEGKDQSQSSGQGQQQDQQGQQKPQHKEGEMDKFRDYIKEDEEMEQEGGTYGGLM